jgi:hypothetical protein
MVNSTSALAILAAFLWIVVGCQGPTLPLSAQQGSSILIPIGNVDTVEVGLIGYGGTLQQDRQRGQLNFFLDGPNGTPLVTRATSIVEAPRQSPLGRATFTFSGEVAAFMVVSLVNIPATAAVGDHDLYVARQRGSEPPEEVPYAGRIKILPSPDAVTGIAGAVSSFIGSPLENGGPFGDLTYFAPNMLPDPMILIAFDQPLHAARLQVYVPPSMATIVDAIDPIQRGRSAAHPALVWTETSTPGTLIVSAIASRDDLPIHRLAIVFKLNSSSAPLSPSDVVASIALATDELGAAISPVALEKWIE